MSNNKYVENIDESNYINMFRTLYSGNEDENTKTSICIEMLEKIKKEIFKNKKNVANFDISEILKLVKRNIQIIFYILENFYKVLDELDIQSLLDDANSLGYDAEMVICLLHSQNEKICDVVVNLLNEKNTDVFLKEIYKKTFTVCDKIFIKNISVILPRISPKYYVNTKNTYRLFCNENYTIRIAAAEISEKMILFLKESENVEQIVNITEDMLNLLIDVNQHVRAKIIAVFLNLFKQSAILQSVKLKIIGGVVDRIIDKAVFVRKKAIELVSQLILNFYENSGEKQFRKLMEDALKNVLLLIESKEIKTDTVEIFGFIKISFFYKIKNCQFALHKMLNCIFEEEKKPQVISTFKDIFEQNHEIMFDLVGNVAFDHLIKELSLDYKNLIRNIKNDIFVSESLYVLKQMDNYKISENTAKSLLAFARDKLFVSKNINEIQMNLEIYNNILCICTKIVKRMEHSNEIFEEVVKDNLKMTFYDTETIKNTIDLFYKTSKGPDVNCTIFIRNIIKSGNKLKLLDAIGKVCLNQFIFVDEIERRIKEENNIAVDDDKSKFIKEKEKRLGSTKKRNSLADSQTLKYSEICEAMKNKNDEEIGDFFAEIRETEILFGEKSFLNQFYDMMVEACMDKNENVKYVANVSLCQCMLVSSRCFKENYEKVFLINLTDKTNPIKLRMSLSTFLNDLIIYYNSLIDSKILFELLKDKDLKKNAILIIFNLSCRNVIRIKKYTRELLEYVEDDEIGDILKSFFCELSKTPNLISVMAYNAFIDDKIDENALGWICELINLPSEKTKLYERCKNITENEGESKKLAILEEKLGIEQKENV